MAGTMTGADVVTTVLAAGATALVAGFVGRKLGMTYAQRAGWTGLGTGVVGVALLKVSKPAAAGVLATGVLVASSDMATAIQVQRYLGNKANQATLIQRPAANSANAQLSTPSTTTTTQTQQGTTNILNTQQGNGTVVGQSQAFTAAPNLRRVA